MNILFHVLQQDLQTIHFYWSLSKPEEGPHLIRELDAKKNQHKLLGSILSGSSQALPGFTWIIYASVCWRPLAAFTVTHVGCPSGSVSNMQVCEDAPFLPRPPPAAVWWLICY